MLGTRNVTAASKTRYGKTGGGRTALPGAITCSRTFGEIPIANEARMAIDIRSNSVAELLKLESQVIAIAQAGAIDENKRWNSDQIGAECNLIGDRPAGITAENSPIVAAARLLILHRRMRC